MPKRKITLDEAFAVFEQHGLKVEVKGLQADEPAEPLAAFLDQAEPPPPIAEQISAKQVRVTLYAAHSIGTSGQIVVGKSGEKHVVNSSVQTYGPGIITVPAHLAQHLLHQDALARAADDRLLSHRFISKAIVSRGNANCAVAVSDNPSFDIASFLVQPMNIGNMYMA